MTSNAVAAVWGALVADSLALGAHWIYDTGQIDSQIGKVDRLMDPPPNSFHPTKKKGEFTHYGDQVMVLLSSVAESDGFRLEAFADAWRAHFAAYDGYFDHATKETLKNFEAGNPPHEAGSGSSDLSAAARIAPLACRYADDPQALVAAVRAQAAMTHNAPDVVDAAEFFARTLVAVLAGRSPLEALNAVRREHFDRPPFDAWVAAGLNSVGESTRSAIQRFGQMCDVGAGFPGVVHLMASYDGRFEDVLVANVMAGGDSAARGLLAGTILGAAAGMDGIPERWRAALVQRERIQNLIDRLTG
ncbi:MAG: ADP-ribosylglycohydrolase family protein [Desulfobacterales bacterium]|nr:ADP-ribosylglycohydrolase family protein [Desulfobacterales bacterium]